MSSWREQALVEAPVEKVWEVVGDPARFPEWAAEVIEVTGLAEVEEGATYRQRSRVPFGTHTTSFEIEELEDMRRICLRCAQAATTPAGCSRRPATTPSPTWSWGSSRRRCRADWPAWS